MSTRPLFALTLHRPWAALIVQRLKNVENRTWEPPEAQLKPGEWFAIHAGKTWDEDCAAFASEHVQKPADYWTPEAHVDSAIVGVARFDGIVRVSEVLGTTNPWLFGPIGWLIGDAVAIEPVPCRGKQKLWEVPTDVAELVRQGFKKARHGKEQADG